MSQTNTNILPQSEATATNVAKKPIKNLSAAIKSLPSDVSSQKKEPEKPKKEAVKPKNETIKSQKDDDSVKSPDFVPQVFNKWEDVNIKEKLLHGIYNYGWSAPSSIQQQGIPAILTSRDVIMQAPSGMGKTGTFLTSLLQMIDESHASVQAVVLTPTRELADQVYKVAQALGDHLNVNFVKCVGGIHVRDNLPHRDRATILIGTTGKLCAVLGKRLIKSQPFDLRIMIIDEFDKMLEEDNVDTIKEIFGHVGKDTQVVLSSATVNDQVLELTDQFMRNPIHISVKAEELTLEGIQQYRVECGKEEWKFEAILDLYNSLVIAQSVIFVNSVRKCADLEKMFGEKGFAVQSIHGKMEQSERDVIMNNFRAGKIRVLLSTDLTARGIDVPGVSLVINYDLPTDKAQYLHRIGRTGRFGKKGSAINLIASGFDKKLLQSIENHYRVSIPELPMNFASIIS